MYLLHRGQLSLLVDLPSLVVLPQVLVLGLLYETLEELKLLWLPVHLEEVESHAPPLYACEFLARALPTGGVLLMLLLPVDGSEGRVE